MGADRRGARVVGMVSSGAWAEFAAVGTDWLAELPDDVSFEQAAALPVAGLTALRALEVGGFLLGKPVLVTGASGGVGRFAIQLAKLAGAHVTALARRTEGLAELGADEVITEIDLRGPTYELIVDAVGADVLGAAIQRVAPGGTVVSFASTVPEPVSYPARELFARAPRAKLYGLYIFAELEHSRTGATDLRRLADLVAAAARPSDRRHAVLERRRRGDRGAARPARQRQGRPPRRLGGGRRLAAFNGAPGPLSASGLCPAPGRSTCPGTRRRSRDHPWAAVAEVLAVRYARRQGESSRG